MTSPSTPLTTKKNPQSTPAKAHVAPQDKEKRLAALTKRTKSLAQLGQHWPIFTDKAVRPLAIGTHKVIYEEAKSKGLELSKKQIREGIKAYVRRIAYLEAVINQTHRYDLAGEPVSTIDSAHKEKAKQTLTELKAKMGEREAKKQSQKKTTK